MRQVSSTNAKREFSKILRRVRDGERFTVTFRGEPVAVISPIGADVSNGQDEVKTLLVTRLRAQQPAGAYVRWTRDDVYDHP
jgi:prevent-host-death family protein